MKLTLAENIRKFRKQKKMTQEKLAEALGVTVGAVYKWESGLSMPELNMIVEIADFFDISVDVLLGHSMRDNRLEPMYQRIAEYCKVLDPAALTEAEKALGKYPHSFKVVICCADVYTVFGATDHNQEHLKRGLELLEQAMILLPQNQDPHYNESIIYGKMATLLLLLDEKRKSVDLLKEHNAGGIFDSNIGAILAMIMHQPDEAISHLDDSLLDSVSNLLTTIVSYVYVYCARRDWNSALHIISWGVQLMTGLRQEPKTDYLDKVNTELLALQAYVLEKAGKAEDSAKTIQEAAHRAYIFDSMPEYSLRSMQFGDSMDQAILFDIFGSLASESVTSLFTLLEEKEWVKKWKELLDHEQQSQQKD